MKLATSIPPRRDGTVRAAGMTGREYTFTSVPPDGELVADVDHDDDLVLLLATGHFYPADPADFDVALAKLPVGQGDPPQPTPAPPPTVEAPPPAPPPARKRAAARQPA